VGVVIGSSSCQEKISLFLTQVNDESVRAFREFALYLLKDGGIRSLSCQKFHLVFLTEDLRRKGLLCASRAVIAGQGTTYKAGY
jgi:hypothetical protein